MSERNLDAILGRLHLFGCCRPWTNTFGGLFIVTCMLCCGCNAGDSQDRNEPAKSTSSSGKAQQPGEMAPPKNADPNLNLDQKGGQSSSQQDGNQPDDSDDSVQSTVPKSIPGAKPETSAISQAVETVQAAPDVDLWEKPLVEPADPHPELSPLIGAEWVRLHPGYEVWLDMKMKQVVVGGRICFRDGPLEMFACPMQTKEHESIVSTISNAEIVHTGLLAVGAVPGQPFQWDPEYVSATGPVVKIDVVWTENDQRRTIEAREMVLDVATNKPLNHDWVFCGSGEWRDPDNPGYREYWADAGDMICVTNFSTAMLDLQIESSSMQSGLRFHANPEKIPELGKPVLLFLQPDLSTNPAAPEANAQ